MCKQRPTPIQVSQLHVGPCCICPMRSFKLSMKTWIISSVCHMLNLQMIRLLDPPLFSDTYSLFFIKSNMFAKLLGEWSYHEQWRYDLDFHLTRYCLTIFAGTESGAVSAETPPGTLTGRIWKSINFSMSPSGSACNHKSRERSVLKARSIIYIH